MNSMNNTLLIKEYIKALIENIDKKQLPKELNLIFDGGLFNCGFSTGVALYIKTLEETNLISVKKLSGCSAGSLIALWYIGGCNELGIDYFETIMQTFKRDLNFSQFKSSVAEFVDHLFKLENNDYKPISILDDKLFINYYDASKNKQKVISKFTDRAHLIKCILRSCHIPYLIDGNARCEERYLDGIVPYIFNDGESLFIKLLTFNKFTRSFILKSEANIHFRLLSGVSDANDFFTRGNSDMCCYISHRSYNDIFLLRAREMASIVCFFILDFLILFKNALPPSVKNSFIYNGAINTSKCLVKDIFKKLIC